MQYEGVERQAVEVLLLALRSPLLAWLDSSLERPAVSRTNSSTATDPRAILDVALDNWETLRRKRRLPGKFKDALYNVRSLRDQWAHWQEISPERVAAGVISARFLLSVINDVEALEALEVALYDLDAKAVAEMTGIAAARQQVADLESLLAQTMAELDAATPNLAVIPPAGPSPDELNMQPMGSPSLPTATPADRFGVPLNLPAGELAKNGSSPTVDAESERQISLLAAKVEHL